MVRRIRQPRHIWRYAAARFYIRHDVRLMQSISHNDIHEISLERCLVTTATLLVATRTQCSLILLHRVTMSVALRR